MEGQLLSKILPKKKKDNDLIPLPFHLAIRTFKDKVIIPDNVYQALKNRISIKADIVSNMVKADMLTDIYEALENEISKKGSIDDFNNRIDNLLISYGWGDNGWHRDVIIGTNIQSDFNIGKFDEIILLGSEDKLYGEYDSINDDKRCEICADIAETLQGKVYPLDHEIWDIYWPQQHHWCRCRVNIMTYSEALFKGLQIIDDIPDLPLPDEGFRNNPAKVSYIPDLNKYPEELKKQILK